MSDEKSLPTAGEFAEWMAVYDGAPAKWVEFHFPRGKKKEAEAFASGVRGNGWFAAVAESKYYEFTRVTIGLAVEAKSSNDQP